MQYVQCNYCNMAMTMTDQLHKLEPFWVELGCNNMFYHSSSMIPGTFHLQPYVNIWTDSQCPNAGRGPTNGNLEDCKNSCMENPSCTAISLSPSDCVLRACKIPIPEPSWKLKDYKGYIMKTRSGRGYFFGGGWG